MAEYIGKFRAGSIQSVMPETAKQMTVEAALRAGIVEGVNVRKLLTDLREKFQK